jgi:hypothetical protein
MPIGVLPEKKTGRLALLKLENRYSLRQNSPDGSGMPKSPDSEISVPPTVP